MHTFKNDESTIPKKVLNIKLKQLQKKKTTMETDYKRHRTQGQNNMGGK